ncbi:ABC transporter substrate-binding protein [Oligoflexia bacterium]|nr:ABC transporter substrate-binding protein [Oligoflexia bacterium]
MQFNLKVMLLLLTLPFSVFSEEVFSEEVFSEEVFSEGPRKIGVSTALTGNASTYGIDIKNALLFANKKLTGGRYQLIIEDDRCSGQGAATIAHKLINVDRVKFVLGFACSSTVLASAPIYEKAEVIAISASAAAEAISQAGDFIFRTWPSDVVTVRLLHNYISSHHKVLGIVSEETEYAQGLLRSLQEKTRGSHLKLVSETFLTNDTGLRSVFEKMRQNKIDGMFLNSQSERTFLALLKQLRELGLTVPVYGVYWPGSPTFLNQAGKLADGIIYVDAPTVEEVLDPQGKALYEEFLREYGPPQYSGILFATAFESFRAMHSVIESGADPRKHLYTTKFQGLFGEYAFDKNGDIVGMPMMLKRIEGGKIKSLD